MLANFLGCANMEYVCVTSAECSSALDDRLLDGLVVKERWVDFSYHRREKAECLALALSPRTLCFVLALWTRFLRHSIPLSCTVSHTFKGKRWTANSLEILAER